MSRQTVLTLTLAVLGARSPAQTTGRIGTDTTPPDSGRHFDGPTDNWLLLPVMAGFMGVMAVAPAGLIFVGANPPGALPSSQLTVFVTGGVAGTLQGNTFHGFLTQEIEGWSGHWYGDIRDESFTGPTDRRFVSARAGYLLHPRPGVVGGLTIGYRGADNGPAPHAASVGLPMGFGSARLLGWVEPTYLISPAGVSWDWRFRAEFNALPTHLIGGVDFDVKPLQQGGPYVGAVTFLFGVRY